jgi:hypothetical protein
MVYSYNGINIGAAGNDGTGDSLRDGLTKANAMLQELMTSSGRSLVTSVTANLVFASPSGTPGYGSFRALVNDDFPALVGASTCGASHALCNVAVNTKGLITSVSSIDIKAYVESIACPVGSVITMAGSTVPPNYLECDGSEYSATTYASLYAVIGTMYGSTGAGSFKVPDYRGYFHRGWAHGSTVDPDKAARTDRGDTTGGDVVGSVQGHAFTNHTHTYTYYITGGSGGIENGAGYTDVGQTGTSAGANTGSGNETRPINKNVMYCIKY